MSLFKRKKRYSKIPYEKRLKLIELVDEQKLFIYQAAKRLRIKLPTAKIILQNYRKTGKIFQKRVEDKHQPSQIEDCESSQNQISKEEEEILENDNPAPTMAPLLYYVVYPFASFSMI